MSEDSRALFDGLRSDGPRPSIPGGPDSTVDVLERALGLAPQQEAVVGRHGRLTYEALDAAANAAARVLRDLGVRPGDRVAASLPNDVDIVVVFHGVMRAGAVFVGVNTKLAAPEKTYILQDAGVRVFVGDAAMAAEVGERRHELPDLVNIIEVDPTSDDIGWRAAVRSMQQPGRLAVEVDPWGPAGIAYTSGTTGFPKGVVHSHHNLLLPGAVGIAARGWGRDLRKGDCFPLTILNLQVLSTLLVPQAVGTSVLIDRVDPVGIAEWIRTERVTVFNGAPAMLYSLATSDDVVPEDLSSLREVISGGSDTPEPIVERFRERFGQDLLSSYGLTEAPTFVTFEHAGRHVPGSSGIVIPSLELVIVDDEDRPLPPGATGEICLRGVDTGPWAGVYTPMLGYLHKPEATAEVLRHGMLHTGDIGHVDEQGNLRVTDRKNLMILRGGANIYPAEVERVLYTEPAVAACAVTGIPDERLGQRVIAFVELAPGMTVTEENLRELCEANLAKYKVPERITFLAALPRNSMGKIVRTELSKLDPAG